MDKNLGNLIKDARIKKGISQRELARRIDISKSYMNKIESNEKTKPNIITLFKISSELNIDINELLILCGYDYSDLDILNQANNNINLDWELTAEEKQKYMVNGNIDILLVLDDYKKGNLDDIQTISLFLEVMGISNKFEKFINDYFMKLLNNDKIL